MLQQTRVDAVIPYFESWMERFPTVEVLARSSEHEVLHIWEGLGYYSRARNLHKAAKVIVSDHEGELPGDRNELLKIPGIGPYTAGAILSIVFGRDEPALDGNLKRVYARLFDLEEPIDSQQGDKRLWKIARKNLPKGRAGEFNQALMDLGSAICIPKNPRCPVCPVKELCMARINGTQLLRPVKKPRPEVPLYIHAAVIVLKRRRVLLKQRPSTGLLAGMWEFPNVRIEGDPARALGKALRSEYRLKVRKRETLGIFEHAYTHFKVVVHAFLCDLVSLENRSLKWVSLDDLENYPMGKVNRNITRTLIKIAS